MLKKSCAVLALAAPFAFSFSAVQAQEAGFGSSNRGSAEPPALTRGVIDFELPDEVEPRGLPEIDPAELEEFLRTFTREILTE